MQATDFVALYRGPTVGEARLVAVTAEPQVVGQVIRALIGEVPTEEREDGSSPLRLLRAEREPE
jgi:hypothetical protein